MPSRRRRLTQKVLPFIPGLLPFTIDDEILKTFRDQFGSVARLPPPSSSPGAKRYLTFTEESSLFSFFPTAYENEPVLYYLKDGPKRGFVREELMIVPRGTELPPE